MVIYTTDNNQTGVYRVFVRAKFNIQIPYYVDTDPFTVTVIDQCVKNVISGWPLQDRAYNVSKP